MTLNTKPIDVWLYWCAVVLAVSSMVIARIEDHWTWGNFAIITMLLLLGFIKPILIKWREKNGKTNS